jgi:hypothetical protein
MLARKTKAKLCRVPDETFDFLGYTFDRCYSPRTGRAFIGTTPMRKKVRRLCDNLREDTSRRKTLLDEEEVVGRLNRKLRGWANYFKLGFSLRSDAGVSRVASFSRCLGRRAPGYMFLSARISKSSAQDEGPWPPAEDGQIKSPRPSRICLTSDVGSVKSAHRCGEPRLFGREHFSGSWQGGCHA